MDHRLIIKTDIQVKIKSLNLATLKKRISVMEISWYTLSTKGSSQHHQKKKNFSQKELSRAVNIKTDQELRQLQTVLKQYHRSTKHNQPTKWTFIRQKGLSKIQEILESQIQWKLSIKISKILALLTTITEYMSKRTNRFLSITIDTSISIQTIMNQFSSQLMLRECSKTEMQHLKELFLKYHRIIRILKRKIATLDKLWLEHN